MSANDIALHNLLSILFQAHPWHGVPPGKDAPEIVNAYIELLPTDTVKYELDKASGHLRLDRPQRYSSLCPTPYGFIPQTYCGGAVAALSEARTGRRDIKGDGDPMDICVLTEKTITHGSFLIRAKPIGGLRMIDGEEADDKIIAVLEHDVTFGHIEDINDVPNGLIERLRHYFLSYKQIPEEGKRRVEITDVYNRAEAIEVLTRSLQDYRARYGAPETRIAELRRLLSS
ncbi:MAG: inorganic pyrophosphatase [Pyrinomonadaceae bacterium]|jgi:inorganic pyrophosphatase|nr:inorganic pyrophosphatase [Pyrinomonadaceae bacterium]